MTASVTQGGHNNVGHNLLCLSFFALQIVKHEQLAKLVAIAILTMTRAADWWRILEIRVSILACGVVWRTQSFMPNLNSIGSRISESQIAGNVSSQWLEVSSLKHTDVPQRWNRSRFSWPDPTGNLSVKPTGWPAKITIFRSDIATPDCRKTAVYTSVRLHYADKCQLSLH